MALMNYNPDADRGQKVVILNSHNHTAGADTHALCPALGRSYMVVAIQRVDDSNSDIQEAVSATSLSVGSIVDGAEALVVVYAAAGSISVAISFMPDQG